MTYVRKLKHIILINNVLKSQNRNASAVGVNLSYDLVEDARSKNSTANPIIISHGLMGQKNNWKSVSKSLLSDLKPARKIYLIDNRNHGASPHTPDHSYELMNADNLQLYSTLGLKKAVFLGHSMGGRAVMYTALTNPEKVSSLIIVDISPINEHGEMSLSQPLELLETIDKINLSGQKGTLSDARKYADQLLKKDVDNLGLRQFLLQNLKQNADKSFGWKVNTRTLIKDFKNIRNLNLKNLSYNKSMLLIAGEESPFVPKSHIQPIMKIFPKARIEYVPETGHLVHMEDTETFCRLVVDFLKNEE